MPKNSGYSFTVEGPFQFKDHNIFDLALGASIWTVFLNESSVVIERCSPKESMDGKGRFYNKTNRTIFKVKETPHGEKYLMLYDVSKKMGLTCLVSSQDIHINVSVFLPKSNFISVCSEMSELIHQHLSKLLGIELDPNGKEWASLSRGSHPLHVFRQDESYWSGAKMAPELLFYPFMRKQENREFLRTLLTTDKNASFFSRQTDLTLKWEGIRGIGWGIRNCVTLEEFIRALSFKSAVQTKEDVEAIIDNPDSLRMFANLDLGMGAKEAISSGCVTSVEENLTILSGEWLQVTRFLLTYLPKHEKQAVFDLLTRVASHPSSKKRRHKLAVRLELNIVPMKKRHSFAKILLQECQKSNLYEDMDPSIEKCQILPLDLRAAIAQTWYYAYFTTIPEDSVSRCIKAAEELFGVDLKVKNGYFIEENLFDTPLGVFFLSHPHFGKEETDGDYLLRTLFSDEKLRMKYKPSIAMCVRDYLPKGYQQSATAVEAGVLEVLLRKFAAKIDAALVKLDVACNPVNRIIYLKAQPSNRDYKNSWRYYSLGITDATTIYKFKQAGFTSKADIREWLELRDTLPNDVYLELLDTAAGY